MGGPLKQKGLRASALCAALALRLHAGSVPPMTAVSFIQQLRVLTAGSYFNVELLFSEMPSRPSLRGCGWNANPADPRSNASATLAAGIDPLFLCSSSSEYIIS